MSETLYVHYQQSVKRASKVGEITLTEASKIHFRYSRDWLASTASFPISISLPLDGALSENASHHFFANLLPEANVRQQICKSLGISNGNDFQLLKAIGGDCAGALKITTANEIASPTAVPNYEEVTESQLAQWSIGSPDAFAAVTGHNDVRLSLAGAQDKLPVHIEGDRVWVPLGDVPSTHILKFASPFYSHLPENETFISMLATEIGLPTAPVSLRKTERSSIAIITRYDRFERDGVDCRLHQEDFCQALGISPLNKYEKEGGPRFQQCAEILRRHASFPLIELQKLLQWGLFNLLVGNADAHGKNLSLLYDERGGIRLAPFYDLVCTRNYKRIARDMAMGYGGMFDPDLVGSEHLDTFARDIGIRPNLVARELDEMMDRVTSGLAKVATNFAERFGKSPVLERLPIVIRKQIRRVRSQRK
jgi:serine/threonine-protein kinase HipA